MNFKSHRFLVKNLREGDRKAFTYLIDRYHHELCVYANSLINNHIQAEDVVQNVFINVWEKRTNIREDASLKSFLYKSVYNEFIDQYRKTQSVLRIEKQYIEYLNSIVLEEKSEDTEKMISLVKQIIEELPPKCKHIFTLSKREGLTNIEIATHLNISVKAVEAQITKGYKIIRKSFKEKVKAILFFLFGVGARTPKLQ